MPGKDDESLLLYLILSTIPDPGMEYVTAWILHLRDNCSIADVGHDPGCPYGNAMRIFQSFTNDVISCLALYDDRACELAYCSGLTSIYRSSETLFYSDYDTFHSWLFHAMTRHPYRRTPKAVQILAVIEAQQLGGMSLLQKCAWVSDKLDSWFKEAYAEASVMNDPDGKWFFRCETQVAPVDDDDRRGIDNECPICTETFVSSSASTSQELKHFPFRTLCGHVFCGSCLENWLHESPSHYTCPHCRQCLVCGKNNCTYHVIPAEPAHPVPLDCFINYLLAGRDIEPSMLWQMRETTRGDRISITYLNKVLDGPDAQLDEPTYMRKAKGRNDLWDKVGDTIMRIYDGQQSC
jgi:hypothetical protein